MSRLTVDTCLYWSLICLLSGMTARLEQLENQLLSRKWSGNKWANRAPQRKKEEEEEEEEEEEGTSWQDH